MRALAFLTLMVLPLGAAAQAAPYAGMGDRAVVVLSAEDTEWLLAGRGLGYALSAEMNGHPSPAHLLEMSGDLGLDGSQVEAIAAARDRMTAEARALGADLVAAERAIDAAFKAGGLERGVLTALTAEAARVEGALRAAHLAAHLEVTPLLSSGQVEIYRRLRGYAGDGAAPPAPLHHGSE